MNNLKILLALLYTSMLVACGGGSNSNPGEEAQVLGAENSSQLITGITGRSIAVDTMELLGVMLAYEGYLNSEITTPVAGACGKSGVKTVVVTDADGSFGNNGDSVEINYDECKDLVGGLVFTINGQHLANFESSKVNISSSSLTISDSQGSWTLTNISLVADKATNDLTVKMSVDGSRFDLKAEADSGGQSFVGTDLLCPDGGKLTITASDGSFVTINGAPGENLSLDINGENETLACTEIEVNKEPPSDDNELTPPSAP